MATQWNYRPGELLVKGLTREYPGADNLDTLGLKQVPGVTHIFSSVQGLRISLENTSEGRDAVATILDILRNNGLAVEMQRDASLS